MVIAELTHNPYLLTTKVKFNGKKPRINSQIEKYENQPLKDWVHKIPEIFYNEMNGYDFEFYFVGTKSDFEEIKMTFVKEHVTSDQVRMFHKKEIEDADIKIKEIENLIDWMREHPNRQFDFEEFWEDNIEIFENSYPYILFYGNRNINFSTAVLSLEIVVNAQELASTNLRSIPILFIIEKGTTGQFRKDLITLLARKDIRQEQLFFMINPSLNRNQVIRVISDLGVKNPQVVDGCDDEVIFKYIKNYPVTENIRAAIAVFSSQADKINHILDEKNKESEITNAGIRAEINSLDKSLEKLQDADEFFVQRDNYAMPQKFLEICKTLEDKLIKWKNRKTKVTNDNEAERFANDYVLYINSAVDEFVEEVGKAYQEAGRIIIADFSTVYLNTEVDVDYYPVNIVLKECGSVDIPNMTPTLLELKEITYEESKTFGLFRKTSEVNGETTCIRTYYLKAWRSKVVEVIKPIVDQFVHECFESLLEYYNCLADAYHRHLAELISIKMNAKEAVAAGLSEDERKLQEDNDWLLEFSNQLQNIERG